MDIDLSPIMTEKRNPNSINIDKLSAEELVTLINSEDQKVALAVAKESQNITRMINYIVEAFTKGGRLIYIGAGTSGRLGVLDASECPPTFGTTPEQVIGIIAGGDGALRKAIENAEDDSDLAVHDLKRINLSTDDVVVGISASGRTPYVIAGLKYAQSIECVTGAVACSAGAEMSKYATISIVPMSGPEVLTGSTRMKSGSAQKMVLNTLTTGAMIKTGKVFGNLMVDVKPSNEKLVSRQTFIVMEATGATKTEAELALEKTERNCKAAILMLLGNVDAEVAILKLEEHNGFIRKALEAIN